jgi:glycosyltransferase involved in cell wall biosynthesis
MSELVVLVPVLNRPGNVRPLVESWRASKTPGRLCFILSDGDTEEETAVFDADNPQWTTSISTQDHTSKTTSISAQDYASKMNHGYKETTAPWLLLAADDITFTPGWWDATKPARDAGYQVIGTNDDANPRVTSGAHSTHTLVARDYITTRGASLDGPGVLCHEGYGHNFVDDELIGLARARGVWTPCLDAHLPHRHPAFGTAENDDTYRKGQASWDADRDLWQSRRPLVFQAGEPFPHIVLDGGIDSDVAKHVANEFPPPIHPAWKRYRNAHEDKWEGSDPQLWGRITREVLDSLTSPEFTAVVSELTGIPDLVPDTIGGGYHLILPGGYLKMHADFSKHPHDESLYRRVNLLVFLNEDWRDEWGGMLELSDGEQTVQQISPIATRIVVFSTGDRSFHGHPEPLACPPNRSRKSLAVYYFSSVPPQEHSEHSTLWMEERRDVG